MSSTRKYPYSPLPLHRRDWDFLGEWEGGNSFKTKTVQCDKLIFPEGAFLEKKNHFCRGGVDIFCNYTSHER